MLYTEPSKALDSSLKRHTALIKRMRQSLGSENHAQVLKDLESLSLEKYVDEISSAAVEGIGRCKTEKDVWSAVEVRLILLVLLRLALKRARSSRLCTVVFLPLSRLASFPLSARLLLLLREHLSRYLRQNRRTRRIPLVYRGSGLYFVSAPSLLSLGSSEIVLRGAEESGS